MQCSRRSLRLPERQWIRQGQLYSALGEFCRGFLVGARLPLESLFGPYAGRHEPMDESGPLRLYLNCAGTCRG